MFLDEIDATSATESQKGVLAFIRTICIRFGQCTDQTGASQGPLPSKALKHTAQIVSGLGDFYRGT